MFPDMTNSDVDNGRFDSEVRNLLFCCDGRRHAFSGARVVKIEVPRVLPARVGEIHVLRAWELMTGCVRRCSRRQE